MAYLKQGGMWVLKQPAVALTKEIVIFTGFRPYFVRVFNMDRGWQLVSLRGQGTNGTGKTITASGVVSTSFVTNGIFFFDRFFYIEPNTGAVQRNGEILLVECWTDDYQAAEVKDKAASHYIELDSVEEWIDPGNSREVFNYGVKKRKKGRFPAVGGVYKKIRS